MARSIADDERTLTQSVTPTENSPLLAANGNSARYSGDNAADARAEDPLLDPEADAGSESDDDDMDKPKITGVRIELIIPALAIGIFLAAMDNTLVVSTYGAIGTELNALNQTSWIATAYFLTTTAFQPLYGKLSDIFGRKQALLFSYVVFGTGCLLCGLSKTMWHMVAARALAGVGGGGMTTVASILVSDLVPLRTRGRWQGILNVIFSSGSAAGAPLGGLLSDTIGWRWAFILQFPMTILAVLVVSLNLNLPAPPLPPNTLATPSSSLKARFLRVDFSGALTLVVSVLSLLIGLDYAGNTSLFVPLAYIPLIISLFVFLIFTWIEHSLASEPFAPPHIVKERSIFSASSSNFFSFGSYMSLLFYIPLYYQVVVGLNASESGVRLLPAIFGTVTGSLGAGVVIEKTGGYYYLTVGGYTLQLVGTILIPIVPQVSWMSVGILIAGLGLGISVTASLIAIIATAGSKDQAVATAVSYLFRSLGTVVGVGVASMMVQGVLRKELRRRLEGQGDVEEIVSGVKRSLEFISELPEGTREIVKVCYGVAVKHAFWFSAGLCAVGVVSSLFIREKKLMR